MGIKKIAIIGLLLLSSIAASVFLKIGDLNTVSLMILNLILAGFMYFYFVVFSGSKQTEYIVMMSAVVVLFAFGFAHQYVQINHIVSKIVMYMLLAVIFASAIKFVLGFFVGKK